MTMVSRPAPMRRFSVAFGPEAPGWGSWSWVGADTAEALAGVFDARTFAPWEVPYADVVVVVKHPPPNDWADRVARRSALVYAPVNR